MFFKIITLYWKIYNFFSLILFHLHSFSQVKFIVYKIPEYSPKDIRIFIAGSFNSWNPRDPKYMLKRNTDGSFSTTIKRQKGSIEFKFTCGSWETVERDRNGLPVANRSFHFGIAKGAYYEIESWSEKNVPVEHTAGKNVSILNDNFYIPQLNRYRRIWLYLPPDYATSDKKYPVLYMHDGQNLFDKNTSFTGEEWGIDKTLDSFAEYKDVVPIVVGIDNGGAERINELSPWENKKNGGGDGDKYAQFVVETLKPYIDKKYRTLVDRENTMLMGSSLGGLISLYMGVKYQNVFGKIGVFSPAFWYVPVCYQYAGQTPTKYPTKIYFLGGGKESDSINVVADAKKMYEVLLKNGYNKENLKVKEVPDGIHSEWFWKQEFPNAMEWLYYSEK